MSEELRRKSMEWAVAVAKPGDGECYVIKAAQGFYDYVRRFGEFAVLDKTERENQLRLWNDTQEWRSIVSRIGPASEDQRAAVWAILKDVQPWNPEDA